MTPPRAAAVTAAAAVLLGGCGGSTERSTAPAASTAAMPTPTADPAGLCRTFAQDFADLGKTVTALPPPQNGRLVPEAAAAFAGFGSATASLAEQADGPLASAFARAAAEAKALSTQQGSVPSLNAAVDGVQEACGPV